MDFLTDVLNSGIRLCVPIALAATGEVVAQRSGVLNIGLEAMMVAGGFVGFLLMLEGYGPVFAVTAAVIAGMVVATIMVAFSVKGRVNQIVTGLALVALVPGIVDFLYTQSQQQFSSFIPLGPIHIPVLDSIPFLGPVVFAQNAFFYLTIVLVIVMAVVIRYTRFGLEVVAVGHDPDIAAAKGVDSLRVRTLATLIAGGLAGLGGAALTVGALGSYTPGAIGGRGFVAIAIVILGGWRFSWVFLGAILFGVIDALQLRLTSVVPVPVQLLAILPWIVVLIMLILGSRKAMLPGSLAGLARSD